MAALCGDVFISKIRKLSLSIPVFQSFPSSYPTILCKIFIRVKRIADHRCIFLSFFFVSEVISLLILAPLKKISWKEFKFKTTRRHNVSDNGGRGNKKLREQALCDSSSSQESSSTPSVKDILRRRIEQKRVQQNEERFSRSQDNATLSNRVSIF